MDLLSKYAILEHIRYEMESELGKRVFIIPNVQGMPDMKNVLCLSDTSLEIWEMIVCGCNCVQIMKEICLKYVVKEEDIQGDVIEFLGGLIDKGYIAVLQEENEI